MKLTEEFPMNVNPVHPGMYRVRDQGGEVRWARWTGARWNCAVSDFATAAKTQRISTDCYSGYIKGWRGLA